MVIKMYVQFSSFSIFMGLCTIVIGDLTSNYGYSPWIPKSTNRTDLRCPSYCSQLDPAKDRQTKEKCCICNSEPYWQILQSTKMLKIEYIHRNGVSEIIDVYNNNSEVLSLDHQGGFLSQLPINICKFQSIVKIDLRRNFISNINNLWCLKDLDTVDLRYNKIQYISNTTFRGLTHLRILKLTNNNMRTLEPFAITGSDLHLFEADFSENSLTDLDVSNFIPENNFCTYNFQNNIISELVSKGGFALNPNKKYEGGNIQMTGNRLTKFIKFEHLGLPDIRLLGKVLDFGFIMEDVKWDCDCSLVRFLEMAENDIRRLWQDYFNMTCKSPAELNGRSIPQLVLNKELDKFICNISVSDKCPPRCYCFHQPHLWRTVVNCTNSQLKKLPSVLPQSSNLTLILNRNTIQQLENKDYLKNTTVLQLANNHLSKLNSLAITNLRGYKLVDFSNNMITSLPREVQILNPCKIRFGNLTIDCDCNSIWIRDWLQNYKYSVACDTRNYIQCQTKHGYISASVLSEDDVCDTVFGVSSKIATGIGVFSSISILVSSIIYLFRYEIYLLQRYFISNKSQKIGNIPKYDAFISFNEECDEVRHWAVTKLVKYLEKVGYKVYISCRDSNPGTLKEPELSENVACSRTYIVILSESYFADTSTWTILEWKYIWHNFRGGKDKNIIVINFDHVESFECKEMRMRAFLRLNLDIDFSNRSHKLVREIKDKLGIPVCRPLTSPKSG